MANEAKNVGGVKLTGTGYLYVAPAGTALPTDATTALSSDYKCLGFCSEDGFKETRESSTEDIKDTNGTVCVTEMTEFKKTVGFSMIEVKADVLKEYYGDSNVEVSGTGTSEKITVHDGAYDMPQRVFVIEELLPNNKCGRRVYPLVKVTSWDDIELKAGTPYKFGVTGTASPYVWTSGSKSWSDNKIEYIAERPASFLAAENKKESK